MKILNYIQSLYSGRIGKKDYALGYLLFIGCILVGVLASVLPSLLPSLINEMLIVRIIVGILGAGGWIGGFIVLTSITIKRCRDVGLKPFTTTILTLISIGASFWVALFYLFWADSNSEKYQENELKKASRTPMDKRKKRVALIIIVVGLIIATGLSSGVFDKFLIKRSFEKAFDYRMVGNCEAFIDYIAVDQDRWKDRCLREAESGNDADPIQSYKITLLDVDSEIAYLQVQITRGIEKPYVVNYKMIKEGFTWKIATEILL